MAHLHLQRIAVIDHRDARARRRREKQLRPIRPSRRVELWYRDKLAKLVGQLRRAGADILSGLKSEWTLRDAQDAAYDPARIRARDELPPSLARLMQMAEGKFRGIKAVAKKLAGLAVDQNLAEVDDRVAASIKAATGVDLRKALTSEGPIAEEMTRARRDNVDLITSIPSTYLDKVRDSVADHWNEGKSYESLADRIQEIGDITDDRAALIARDQTGKMNSSFNLVRQTSLGIEKYEWQTAGDERVRDSHRAMNGKTFEWSDPPLVDGERVHPGQGIQCRCVAAPIVDVDTVEANAESMVEEEAA